MQVKVKIAKSITEIIFSKRQLKKRKKENHIYFKDMKLLSQIH